MGRRPRWSNGSHLGVGATRECLFSFASLLFDTLFGWLASVLGCWVRRLEALHQGSEFPLFHAGTAFEDF